MTSSKLGALLGGAGGWALGGPIGAALGGLLGNSIGRRMKAKTLEKRLNRSPIFRAQFERAVGGKYVPDGRNDGKITIARANFGLPGFNPGVFSGLGGNMVAGSALSGLSNMMQNAAGLMQGLGATGGSFAGMSYGDMSTGYNARASLGLNAQSGGSGSRVAKLPANATFEDLVPRS